MIQEEAQAILQEQLLQLGVTGPVLQPAVTIQSAGDIVRPPVVTIQPPAAMVQSPDTNVQPSAGTVEQPAITAQQPGVEDTSQPAAKTARQQPSDPHPGIISPRAQMATQITVKTAEITQPKINAVEPGPITAQGQQAIITHSSVTTESVSRLRVDSAKPKVGICVAAFWYNKPVMYWR